MNELLRGITTIDLGDVKIETDKELVVGIVGLLAAGLYVGYKLLNKITEEK